MKVYNLTVGWFWWYSEMETTEKEKNEALVAHASVSSSSA